MTGRYRHIHIDCSEVHASHTAQTEGRKRRDPGTSSASGPDVGTRGPFFFLQVRGQIYTSTVSLSSRASSSLARSLLAESSLSCASTAAPARSSSGSSTGCGRFEFPQDEDDRGEGWWGVVDAQINDEMASWEEKGETYQ